MARRLSKAEKIYTAGQWRLMWIRFKKHRLALVSAVCILGFYLTVPFVEVIAPHNPYHRDVPHAASPPMRLHFWDAHERKFHLRPFVYPTTQQKDPDTLQRLYVKDETVRCPLRFFIRGDAYGFWGTFGGNVHLFGLEGEQRLYLLGTDIQGRDLLSRIMYGARISLTIGLVGVALSFTLGIALGAVSGYYGGTADVIIQRVIEVIMAIPSLPLWMALSVTIPLTWPVTRVFFFITIILSLKGWTGMARVVRGKLLSLRDEDFVIAARLDGAGPSRVMFRHLVPSFLSHIIASATLSIPAMILGETALSFLGIGLRAPAISWGVLLKDAQNIQALALMPWLLFPSVFVVVIVLAFNFFGDGLRDAADPYA